MLRNTLKLAVAAVAVAVAAPAFAQNTATDSTQGTATIAAPITLTENSALVFGSLTRPTTGENVVTISPSTCARTIGGGGNGALITAATPSCATYTVGGESGQGFNITHDATLTMVGPGGSQLSVTLTPSATTGTVGNAGTFKIGGSFPVGTNTAAGAYEGSFNVTVAYQ